MKVIAAVDQNWAIGLGNQLLVRIPADQKFFRKETTGKVVVMGRRTFESFPNGQALKNRTNIVLSQRLDFHPEGVIVVRNLSELEKLLGRYEDDSVYCIGGAQVYKSLLPYCDTALITKIQRKYDADTYFPNLDHMPEEWVLTAKSDEQTYFDLEYYFLRYERRKDA
ncbi:MAG: dihydrofolate reductase [Lachnospiraceae bacterium]|nr:dihydrofolate reductase [Lachnospiraceae bacterium]